jgi:hypothetical protein
MAVVITSQFYQAAAWKNISKVVFTSPNIDSPAVAGTRSHILPGEGNLGTWYEDTSSMYRIEDHQEETISDYYNFKFTTTTDLNTYALPATVSVSGTSDSYDVFYDYMKDSVGCTATGYRALKMTTDVTEYRVKLEYSSSSAYSTDDMAYLPNIFSTTITTPGVNTLSIYDTTTIFDVDDTYNISWVVPVITGMSECYFEIDFDKPYKVTKIYMKGQYAYDIAPTPTYFHKRFFGNYTIHGRLRITDPWTLLYTGANTDNIDASVFLSTTAGFYKHYKITILDNTGLTGFATTHYALSSLQFYVYNYNNIPTRNKAAYLFDENGGAEVLYVSDVHEIGLNNYLLDVVDSTMSSGTLISGTLASGIEFKSWGSLSSDVDYTTNDSIVFEVTTGEAYNCRLTAWDDVTHSTTINELIQGDHVRCSAAAYCSTGSKLTPTESFLPEPINYVFGPVHNRIFKGNTIDSGYNYFFGDFDLVYRFQNTMYGDFLIFKPMLYGIDSSISYGVHDFILTLSYSYT